MGAQVCKCNKADLGQFELRRRDPFDSDCGDATLFASIPAPSRDEVLLDKSYRGGTDPDVQCKTGSACENADEWNTEQCGDDVATEHQSALDNTLSGAITGSIHDKPERPLVSSPPLAFTVATGTHKQPHGDLAGAGVAGLAQPSSPEVRGLDTTVKEVEEAVDTNSCTSTQAINEEQEQTEEAASASTLQVGSNPETDSGDSISRWSQGVMQATVQADDGTTTDASGTKRPADWMEDATSARTPADWEEAPSCTNTVSASPAAAGHGEGRELCHISEWYHRVQLVEEEGQTELPALKLHAVAKELQIQECKHSPKSSLKQESKHSPKSSPRKSPSRKPGAGQRASRAEDVMLW
mmetsp:Transcript_130623/g.260627  ORF Transcript_130623/g.260627 Transcript_130623/m.260627 type:complete len:354 (-) Transcript_130623:99-1160(-)